MGTLAGAALLLQGTPALAGESMQVKTLQLDLSPDDGAVLLSAQFALDLSAALKDAVSRQYRLGSATSSDGYTTLDEAIAPMMSVRDWPVATIEQFVPETEYILRVRMRLDQARLPKPFQITALTDSDWNPQSEWKGLTFVVPTQPTPAP